MRNLALTVALAVGLAAPAFGDIVKCQQGIEKNSSKLQGSILKALTKCVDSYRKAVVSNTLATAGPVCQAGLAKVIDHTNPISAIKKTEGALAKLVAPLGTTCSDPDLSALGYLTETPFGDRWRRLTLLAALGGAYDQEQQAVSDLPNALQGLGDNGCALCAALSVHPPCVQTVCDVDASSNFETIVATVPLSGSIAGNTIVSGCEWQDVLPNEIGLIGSTNIGLKPTTVLGTTVCNLGFRTFGVLSCAGSSMPKVKYSVCQDSDTTVSNSCSGDICQPAPDANTSGACITYDTSTAASQGDAFILSTSRLRTSTGAGTDGVFCTPDDTGVGATVASVIPTTTGQAAATLYDYNNTSGNTQTEGPIVGTTGPSCAVARSGSSSGLTLVGAFPGAETASAPSPLHDTVTKITIKCN